VIALDPGHGGTPDNGHPEIPFDPGAIGINGLLEKDLTLDIAQRVRQLLAQDLVQVVMTRDSDRYVSVEERSQAARQAGAALFVSVHLNSWTDPTVGGSLVLYPGPRSVPFATVMGQALQKRLAALGVENKGTELRDNWWIHATMPVVTVEGAYLTNPQEAALLTTASFRQSLAQAIRDGIESFDPVIARQKSAITAWNSAHPAAVVSVGGAGRTSGTVASRSRVPGSLLWVLAIVTGAVTLWYRRRICAFALSLRQRYGAVDGLGLLNGWAPRRRRQVRRRRAVAPMARGPRPHSVYDDLWF